MAKSWADMSKEERSATGKTKKEYNRSTGQSILPKFQDNSSSSNSSSSSSKSSGSSSSSSSSSNSGATQSQTENRSEAKSKAQTYTSTKEGKVEAPSWYKNADGSTPSTMKTGLTQQEWESRNQAVQSEKAKEQQRQDTFNQAQEYMNNHPMAGKGSTRDAGFDQILKDGGMNNHMYNQMLSAQRKQAYSDLEDYRDEERQAYNQSRIDFQNAKNSAGYSWIGNEGLRDSYDWSEDGWGANEGVNWRDGRYVKNLLHDTGYEYTPNEIQRHKNQGEEQKGNQHLYRDFGGYQNWYDNHSLFGEGGFTGSSNVKSVDEIMQRQRDREYKLDNNFWNDFNEKYGKYDFGKEAYDNRYDRNYTELK